MVDVELVRGAQAGDPLAMSALLDHLTPWVGRLCGSIALDAGDEAAQEALLLVFRDLKKLREPLAFRGWVRRIATREAIRCAQRDRKLEGRSVREQTDTLPMFNDPGLARDVRGVLRSLTPEQRAILVLRDLDGMSEEEAAALLKVAQGTVKSRLHRARAAFRNRWQS